MTDEERHVVKHALGLDNSEYPYRNSYAASVGTVQEEMCRRMAEAGHLILRSETPQISYFIASDEAIREVWGGRR
jgi:hypothetical protein